MINMGKGDKSFSFTINHSVNWTFVEAVGHYALKTFMHKFFDPAILLLKMYTFTQDNVQGHPLQHSLKYTLKQRTTHMSFRKDWLNNLWYIHSIKYKAADKNMK